MFRQSVMATSTDPYIALSAEATIQGIEHATSHVALTPCEDAAIEQTLVLCLQVSLARHTQRIALMSQEIASCVLVGVIWGVTDQLIRVGVVRAERKGATAGGRLGNSHWARLLSTPLYVCSQLDNWCGSVLLVRALAHTELHLAAPIANAVALATNAVVGASLGQELQLKFLAPGLLCVALGVFLCVG
jgi:hypothetical protein